MNYPIRISGLVLSILVSAAFGFTAEPAGIKALDDAWSKAMKANDLEAVVALYAPDAVTWMPEAPEASGAAAVRAGFQGMLAAYTVQDAVLSDTHQKTSGNVAASWGHYTLVLAPKAGGAAMTLKGRFTGIAERRAGRWLYISDHASPEPPPAAPAH
jgi:uncharacterized protein (TIGR02246 family)